MADCLIRPVFLLAFSIVVDGDRAGGFTVVVFVFVFVADDMVLIVDVSCAASGAVAFAADLAFLWASCLMRPARVADCFTRGPCDVLADNLYRPFFLMFKLSAEVLPSTFVGSAAAVLLPALQVMLLLPLKA